MSTLRSGGHSDDLRLVRALWTRHPHAAADLDATYGLWLYDYAHALLRDRDWAAEALQSALQTAQARGVAAPDADRLRGWLYGLVRDECMARLADPAQQPSIRHEAPDAVAAASDDPVVLAARRRAVIASLAELNGRERELADLTLRHGLSAVELSEVLGISPARATEQALSVHERIARSLSAQLGKPVEVDRLRGAFEVLPFAAAPADLHDRIATAPALTAVGPPVAGLDETAVLLRPSDDPDPAVRPRGKADKARLWPALAAAVVVVAVVGLVYLVLPHSRKDSASATTPQVNASTAETATLTPEGSTPSSASPDPTTTSPTASLTPSTRTSTSRPTPSRRTTHSPPSTHSPSGGGGGGNGGGGGGGGGLSIDESGCQYVDATSGSATCTLVITARSALRWSVVGGSSDSNGTVSASGGGSLPRGGTASVRVTVAPTSDCNVNGGGGSGSVTFAPSATATINYLC